MDRPALDRESLESALPFSVRAALPELCRLHEAAPDSWLCHPELGPFLSNLAALALRDRGMRVGQSRTEALRRACARLGLSYAAIQRSLNRWRSGYRANGGGVDVLSKERMKRALALIEDRRLRDQYDDD